MGKSKKIFNFKYSMSQLYESLTLPTILILIGALISAVGALLAAVYQSLDQAESSKKQLEYQTELKSKSDEIAELSKINTSLITGGNSVCYLTMSNFGEQDAILAIQNDGKFPLYDVFVRITNLDMPVPTPLTLQDIRRSELSFPVGNIAANKAAIIGSIKLPNPQFVRLNIFISARNGSFVENLRIKKVNGEWKSALRVFKESDSENPDEFLKQIKEDIDSDYPRNKNGEVNL